MLRIPQKAPFKCPGCGFVQFEPPRLISTYCRSCGDYYAFRHAGGDLRGVTARGRAAPEGGGLGIPGRSVICHKCGSTHGVEAHALNTLCPTCNTCIDLRGFNIVTRASWPVDTRGHLRIAEGGSLSSSWIICGSAKIEGFVIGTLLSEGCVKISSKGICACRITATEVLVERDARLTLTLPLTTGHLEVAGHLQGIVRCKGDVHVRRGGILQADIQARSVKVDKGGALLGDCRVAESEPREPLPYKNQRVAHWPTKFWQANAIAPLTRSSEALRFCRPA